MIKKLGNVVIYLLLVMVFFSSSAFAGEKDVVNALLTIRKNIEDGVNYSAYRRLVSTAQTKVNEMKRQRKYTEYNEFILHIDTCLIFFQDAKMYWGWKDAGESGFDESMNYCWSRGFFELGKAQNFLK
jgi:hypothetical protein